MNLDTFAELAYKSNNYNEFEMKLRKGTWGLSNEVLIDIFDIDVNIGYKKIQQLLKKAYFNEKRRYKQIVIDRKKQSDEFKTQHNVNNIIQKAYKMNDNMKRQINEINEMKDINKIVKSILNELKGTNYFDFKTLIPNVDKMVHYMNMWGGDNHAMEYYYENDYDGEHKEDLHNWYSDDDFLIWIYENIMPIRHNDAMDYIPSPHDEVTLYRVITVHELKNIKPKLGIYWSDEISCAEAHWAGDGDKEVTLETTVKGDSIDWKETILLKMFFDTGNDECEIRLLEDQPLVLDTIYIDGKESPIPEHLKNGVTS